MIASRHTQHGDARLHYLDSGGDDHRAPIVFVPGMTDLASDYTEVLASFGRRTAVVELRGHGGSGAPADGYDFPTLSGDVGAVVDAVTDGPVHLVTFSRGTSYALGWALGHPERVRSVAIGDYPPEEKTLADGQAEDLLAGRWRGSSVGDRLDRDAAMKTFAAARDRSMWEPLSRLAVPLLVVRSGAGVIGDDDWARCRRDFPAAELVEFGDSPHDIFRPDRHRYPRLVKELVERAELRHRP
ncbi:alpha/beta fold hydrolase [Mycolicibacterium palauense]|uniref:alpha/beta fold hydrolase n=1 Tax=Mycolicibacterium palauense TaxID=2034511 RepID=UPI000BFEAD20|nr:alpha/beta fold hydrolase [Mycolicibacterium palauense]